MKEYDEYVKDWEFNAEQKSAVHNSGLEVSFENYNEDGSMRLKYQNLMHWQKKIFKETRNGQKVDELRIELSQQFAEIYSRNMHSKTNSIYNVIKKPERSM